MEIELKYAASPEQGKAILKDLSGGSNDKIREIPMEALYYDTKDRSLRDKRLTYRIRKEGESYVLTIKYGRGSDKATSGLHRREEYNVPVSAEFLEKPGIDVLEDTPVYKEYDKAVGGQYSDDLGVMLPVKPLIPEIKMIYTRWEMDVSIGNGTAILSYDEGYIEAGMGRTPISEVEIELSEGSEEELTAFGQKILEKYGLEPLNKSKFARGLKLLDI